MGHKRLRIEWLDKKDNSILYAKYSLMALAQTGEIDFIRIKPSSFDHNILSQRAIDALSPAQAFFVAYWGDKQCKVVMDTSESFFYMSSAIADVDLYFCSSYSPEMFEEHRFLTPYKWQERYDLTGYKQNFKRIEKEFGPYFSKLVRFIPFPVVMDLPVRRFNRFKQIVIFYLMIVKYLRKQIPRQRLGSLDPEYQLFEMRYKQLIGYRLNTLEYDIVVRESLWAWPWHRILLYKSIKRLVNRKIIASLSSLETANPDAWWRHDIPADEMDAIIALLQEKTECPQSYEEMLTSARLALFPTGKHWGWRAITFLSLISGGPVFMDRPLFEPYFPLRDFKLFFTDQEWDDLPVILDQITSEEWKRIRKHNQKAFDRYLAPVPVGRYICKTVLDWCGVKDS